jgi:RHS repeat-associated protein
MRYPGHRHVGSVLSFCVAAVLLVAFATVPALAQCGGLPESVASCGECKSVGLNGRTVYYCNSVVINLGENPFQCDRGEPSGVDEDDLILFVYQSLLCDTAHPDAWKDPQLVIDLICFYMHQCEGLTCADAMRAMRDIFYQLYCRFPTVDEYRRLAQCLGNCLGDGGCEEEGDGKPCRFEPDNHDCDLNNDNSTDCEDAKIFLALSMLCCDKETLTPTETIALLCTWYSSATGNMCGRSSPVACTEVLNCAEEIFGRPLTGDEMALLIECTGCTSNCLAATGSGESCVSLPDVECDVDDDGDVDCEDIARFVALAVKCTKQNCSGHVLTTAQRLGVICSYLTQCSMELPSNYCRWLANCAGEILHGPGGRLSESERAILKACVDCNQDGHPDDPNAPSGIDEEQNDASRDGCGGAGTPTGKPAAGGPGGGTGAAADAVGGMVNGGSSVPEYIPPHRYPSVMPPRGPHPVNFASGAKVETATDLSISVVGGDFSLVRRYTSETSAVSSLVGKHWTMNSFQFIYQNGSALELHGLRADTKFVFDPVGSPVTHWSTGASSTWKITEVSSVSIGASTYDVWRLSEPGVYEIDFYRSGPYPSGLTSGAMTGLMLQSRDAHGNATTYKYETYGATGYKQPRLTSIYLNGDSEASSEAIVRFEWNVGGDADGKLATAHAIRNVGGTWYETDSVEYTYHGATADYLGSAGDLIQVVRRTAVDATVGGAASWARYTQYRYHRSGDTITPVNDDRLNLDGDAGQLRLVIEPEQVEFFAQQTADGSVPAYDTLADGAAQLLAKADDATAFTYDGDTYKIIDLASKVVGYSTLNGTVTSEFLQSGCGCSGAGHGEKLTYEYLGTSSSPTVKVTTLTFSGSVTSGDDYATVFKTTYYDMHTVDGVFCLKNVADVEPSPGSRTWVTHFDLDSSGKLTRYMLPSAKSSYTLATSGTAAAYSASTSAGLVYAFDYNSANRLTEVRLRQGNNATLSNFVLLGRLTYPSSDDSDERTYLPSKLEFFTDDADSTTASKIQTTWFRYGFHSGTDHIAWIQTSVEAETVSENGPSSTGYTDPDGGSVPVYVSHELYDSAGRLRWSRAADGALTYREYDATTGALTKLVRNATTAGETGNYAAINTADFASITVTGWGRNSDGGSLTTQYTVDTLGRTTKRTSPGGVYSYTVRRMATYHERPNILYYSVVSLPHQVTAPTSATYDGPVSISWMSGGGSTLGSSDYTLEPTAGYDPDSYTFMVAASGAGVGEIARSTSQHDPLGQVRSRRVWHDVYNNKFYESSLDYDKLGRLQDSTNANGTITRQTYDVHNRVIKVEVGTTTSNLTTVGEYFYDSAQTASQGTGDGNLTFLRAYTTDNGTLSASQRDTKNFYDFRNRRVEVQGPTTPYSYTVYDNLDRTINTGLFSSDPSAINNPLADRGLYTVTVYNQRGMAYKRQVATDATQSSPTFLESHSWFDANGREIASWGPNAAASKRAYDGLGRVTTEYVTDRGGDAAPGTSGNHADASAVTGDIVFEQTQPTYNAGDGLVTRVTHRQRIHTSSTTGSLTGTISVATFVDTVYDAADRRVGTINYGTNDSSQRFIYNTTLSGSPPTSLPAFTDSGYANTIISKIEYNARGLVELTTDASSTSSSDVRATKYLYDDMSRRSAVVENFKNATIGWIAPSGEPERWSVTSGLDSSEPDTDRVTSFVYDGLSNVTLQVAHVPNGTGENVQITKYVYGVTTGTASTATDSLIYSNDILKEAFYPDETSGLPGSGSTYQVKYSYNSQGELRSAVDQNGTTHTYARDLLGRVTDDTVTAYGSGIDTAIKKISVAYDGFSRLDTVDSKNSSSTIVNGVKFTYTPMWQVAKVYQNHKAATHTSGSPNTDTVYVEYAYSTAGVGSGNYSRLNTLRYPDGSLIYHGYGASSSADDRVSRLTALSRAAISGGSPADLLEYSYIGLGMTAVVDYAQPDVQLDRTLHADGSRNVTGEYPGWDQFGRVVEQAWMDGALGAGAGTGAGYPTRPPIFDEKYQYDRASNRVARYDARVGASLANRDYKFTYDKLDRLTEALRGVYNPTSQVISSYSAGSQQWALDMLGNWAYFRQESSAASPNYTDANEAQARTHNAANEIDSMDRVAPGQSALSIVPTYDDAGNMKERKRSTNVKWQYTHDAWNRLVKVVSNDTGPFGAGAVTVNESEYNGLHWRTVKRCDTTATPNGRDQLRVMYYDASWRLLEERVDDNWTTSSSTIDRHMQNIWGARYIDDLVARRKDANKDGDYTDAGDGTWYAITDVQFSVVAMIDSAAKLVERNFYEPYGTSKYRYFDDVDGDGDVDATDKTTVTGLSGMKIYQSGYVADADIDRSGVIDATDASLVSTTTKAALPAGYISDKAFADNIFGYIGYASDVESDSYTVRRRHYAPGVGRWIERDPAGLRDESLYSYISSRATRARDPMGLCASCDDSQSLPRRPQCYIQTPGDPEPRKNTPKKSTHHEVADYLCAQGAFFDQVVWGGHARGGVLWDTNVSADEIRNRLRALRAALAEPGGTDCDVMDYLLEWFEDWTTIGKHAGEIWLLGCNLATGDDGAYLMRMISALTGRPVRAPLMYCSDRGDDDSCTISPDEVRYSYGGSDASMLWGYILWSIDDSASDCTYGYSPGDDPEFFHRELAKEFSQLREMRKAGRCCEKEGQGKVDPYVRPYILKSKDEKKKKK